MFLDKATIDIDVILTTLLAYKAKMLHKSFSTWWLVREYKDNYTKNWRR